MSLSSCPACGGRVFRPAVPATALHQEVEQRNQFVNARLRRRAPRQELKDLTDLMHDGNASIAACTSCGTLIRAEAETRATASYEEDPNDPGLMQHLFPQYVEAFRRKAGAYRDQLPAHASVIELGSHLGGFLQAAEEWDLRTTGLDIGRDTSEFARRQGLTVRRETLEDSRIAAGSADAVFIWNCFEQLASPDTTLIAARRLLRKHGLLVLRVPNGASWLQLRTSQDEFARSVMAWNNLLGFPYLYGYTPASLVRTARKFGFEPTTLHQTELLTMPFPDPASDVSAEQLAVSAETARLAGVERIRAPWIEVLFRKTEQPGRKTPCQSARFLPRAA